MQTDYQKAFQSLKPIQVLGKNPKVMTSNSNQPPAIGSSMISGESQWVGNGTLTPFNNRVFVSWKEKT